MYLDCGCLVIRYCLAGFWTNVGCVLCLLFMTSEVVVVGVVDRFCVSVICAGGLLCWWFWFGLVVVF